MLRLVLRARFPTALVSMLLLVCLHSPGMSDSIALACCWTFSHFQLLYHFPKHTLLELSPLALLRGSLPVSSGMVLTALSHPLQCGCLRLGIRVSFLVLGLASHPVTMMQQVSRSSSWQVCWAQHPLRT